MNKNQLDSVLEWMTANNECCCDDEGIGYKVGNFATFPISYQDYCKLWRDILIENGFKDYWEDQGWNKDEEWGFPESRHYFEYKEYKFVIVWMSGQGDALLLVFPHEVSDDMPEENQPTGRPRSEGVPWDESKKVVLK